jgi:hypothetical protein
MFAASILQGCATYQDVSGDPLLRGGYVPGEIYVAKVEIAIVKATGPVDGFCLDRYGENTSARYHGEPVVQILPIGAAVRVDKIIHVIEHAPIQGESFTVVLMTALDDIGKYPPLILTEGNLLSHWSVAYPEHGWVTMIQHPKEETLQHRPENVIEKQHGLPPP